MGGNPTDFGCGCDGDCDRRQFLAAMGTTFGAAASGAPISAVRTGARRERTPARVRVVFLYPPSQSFREDPDGWWSWPGNEFDAEGRQKQYVESLRSSEAEFGVKLEVVDRPVANAAEAERTARETVDARPDGLLLVMFYNRSLADANLLLKAAEQAGIPVIFFIGLGVKHGPVAQYRRPGVYFIQSLDNLEAIRSGLGMIGARKALAQCRLLSITEAREPREGVEEFLGIAVRVIPFSRYAEQFGRVEVDDRVRSWMDSVRGKAKELRGITDASMASAARAHFALTKLLEAEQADGVTMNCLRRGMLKPCVSFAMLNDALVPAACENDLAAAYTQLLGQLLTGRPGFQHNPCYETEKNHYYASHCTCPTRLHGPEADGLPYLLRRFAHTNEGSCAVQVFWEPGHPVTMVRYYPGKAPALDVYSGRVVKSHPMPPAAGCTTNVEIEVTDRADACMVRGHHNLLFCGDHARRFRLFAQLHKVKLAETGFEGPWPA